ncbi:hypothetical protein OG559_03295 [Micromonospora sp. NBC_01405]|uniref:hypothetical protein n=1 Tax=Micromonospora sp. NBC_01405 TaxID=2903589 RepID=UPI00324BA446
MANPVIRSITATPSTLQPGQTAQVVIDAYDPDARTVTVTGKVTDVAGHVATATTTLTVGDPLKFELTTTDPAVTIVVDPAASGRFSVRV